MQFLIIGCGSMGKRRARCLRKIGADAIAATDVREDRRAEMASQSGVTTYESFDDAVVFKPDFALVCLPPHLHVDCLRRCIDARIPAFCESPITLTLEDADDVIHAAEKAGVFLAPSCTYLHNQIHKTIKRYLDEQRFGKPLAAVSHVGQHVQDWHPYEDYRGFYASKRSQGGMCFDMLPHDLHLFTHYFGKVRELSCMARRRCFNYETDTAACDVYDVMLDMESGVSLTVHQDMFQRPWGVYRKIMCERGAIMWNWTSLQVGEYSGSEFPKVAHWQEVALDGYDFEQMYVDELEHALRSLRGEETYLMPPKEERRILELILKCEESSRTGRHIRF